MFSRSKRLFLISALVAVMALALAAQAYMQSEITQVEPLDQAPAVEAGEPTDETPELWFVELMNAPGADGTSSAALRNEKNAFRSAARAAGLRYTERYAFDTLWNGLSIRIDRSQLAALSRIPGVKALYPVISHSLPEPVEPDSGAELFTALAQTGANIAQNDLGLSGAGVRVGIIDSGLDIDHPAFRGAGKAGGPRSRLLA